MKIVLDPGHYTGYNAGAISGFYEGNNNFEACVYWKEYIESHYEDVEVILTKHIMDENPTLIERGALGRDADLFYSWHSNYYVSPAAHGVSSFSSVRRDGKKLCDAISDAVVSTFKKYGSSDTYYRGYTQRADRDYADVDYYGVLRSATLENPEKAPYGAKPIDTKCKNAIIIEHGFHSNPAECSVLNNPVALKKIVENEIKAIAKYFDLKERDPKDNYYYFAVLSANKNKKYAEEDVAKAKKLGFKDAYVKYAPRDGAL